MIETIIVLVIFYCLLLGVPGAFFYFKNYGYNKDPVVWILYDVGLIILFSGLFPKEVAVLFPEASFLFLFVSFSFLFIAGSMARIELIGRHPQHNLFLKNRMEMIQFRGKYLLVKGSEILFQQMLFGVLAITFAQHFGSTYVTALASGAFVALLHTPVIAFVRPLMAFGIIFGSFTIAFMVAMAVLIPGLGIGFSLLFHWLLYLGLIPFAWRQCEKETCPIA